MSVVLCGQVDDTTDTESLSSFDIDHCEHLSVDIGNLALDDTFHDVIFVVDNKEFPAHRVILAARCHYFRALLYGNMKEAVAEARINIHETNAEAFEALLRYVYTGKMKLTSMKVEFIIEILGLANKYGFESLEESVSHYLHKSLTIHNACVIFDVALLYSQHKLLEATGAFIDQNCIDILSSDSFNNMSLDATKRILERDSFCVPEKNIFRCVQAWCEANFSDTDDENIENINEQRALLLKAVRFPLIPLSDLINIVRPTGLVSPDALLDAINMQLTCTDKELHYRGILRPNENVATAQHGAHVIEGEMTNVLLDGDTQTYDLDRGYTGHKINSDQCIKVKLGQPTIINRIRVLLWDKDTRSYSYYIEASMNGKDWKKVVDYSEYYCRSWQDVYFEKRVVRYIKLVGTHNTTNQMFHVVAFEAMFTPCEDITLDHGLIVPSANVATVEKSAQIIEGVSRDRNALINGEIQVYDWDSGYTCHQLGNGSIIVQLAQPFLVDSMRLLLWDIDDRSYSYYIEVSCDMERWVVVADKRNEECKSWQYLTFDPIPVSLIRIIGTANTVNEVFHCVHFECPYKPPASSSQSSDIEESMLAPRLNRLSLAGGEPQDYDEDAFEPLPPNDAFQ